MVSKCTQILLSTDSYDVGIVGTLINSTLIPILLEYNVEYDLVHTEAYVVYGPPGPVR